MPPTPTTVSRWELSRANCSMAGASSWHVSQNGDQNQNISGFSPFTTDRRLTVAPVAASNMAMSGTSSEMSKAMGASVVVVAGGSVVAVAVCAAVVSVVAGTLPVPADSSAGVVSATVVSVGAGVVPVAAALVSVVACAVSDVVEVVAVSAVPSPAVVVVASATVYAVSPDASSDEGAVSATLGRVVGTVDVAAVSVATAAGGGAVIAEVGVSGSSTPTGPSPPPHAAISKAVDTTAMTEPADRRSSRRVCD